MGDHGYYDTSPEEDARVAAFEATEREQGYRRDHHHYHDDCLDCGCQVHNRAIHDGVCAPKLARRNMKVAA